MANGSIFYSVPYRLYQGAYAYRIVLFTNWALTARGDYASLTVIDYLEQRGTRTSTWASYSFVKKERVAITETALS